ncbi:MAG: hypothetical protein I4O51_10880 [Flavobacterium micromati]|nr:hypothetical protein [Flavobacterium micromati]
MVTITNEQTKILQSEIEVLAARKAKMRIGQYDNFVRGHMEQYVGRLIESEQDLIIDGPLQINKVDLDNWDGQPNVFGGDVETVLPPHILQRLDKLTTKLEALENNPIYDNAANVNSGGVEMENILQNEINDINNDLTLTDEDKQSLAGLCLAASALVQPEINYFRTIEMGAEILGDNMENFKRRSAFGRIIRAVARVVIAVVAVAILTVIVVKTGGLASVALAKKYAGGGLVKKLLFGVTKTAPSKLLKWYGAIPLGLGSGVVKASDKWDTDMSLKTWYKEFDFKAKAAY